MQGLVLALTLLASHAWGQELTPEWFKSQYLPAAAKVQAAYETSKAKLTQTTTNTKSKDKSVTQLTFALDGRQGKFDRTITDRLEDGSSTSWTRSIVASPDVNFMVLTKHASEPSLERVDRSELGYLFAHRRIKEQACDTVFGAFAFLGKPVSSWLNDDEFKIKSISRIDDRVRMAFTSKGPPQDDREFAGSIDFLPDRQWVIDSWDITITAPKEGRSWRDQVKLTYGGDDPAPRLAGTTLVALHPMLQSTSTTVVDELVFAPTPDDSFRLSSYGYSDRVGLPARLIDSIWFWVGIVGLLCLMAAFVLRYRMQATQAN